MKYYTLPITSLFTLLAALGSTARAQVINNSWDECESGRCEVSAESRRKTADAMLEMQRAASAARAAQAAKAAAAAAAAQASSPKVSNGAAAATAQLNKTGIGKVDMCDQLAGDNEFGRAGQAFLREIQKEEKVDKRNRGYTHEGQTRKVFENLWEGPEDLRKLCVNYGTDKMNVEGKKSLWSVIAAGISYVESTCDASATLLQTNGRNYGAPDGTAHGLVQLNMNDEAKYTARSSILQQLPDLTSSQIAARQCQNGDSRSPERTMTCAAKMLNLQLLRSSVNGDRGQLFSSNWSYWSSLKSRGREGSRSGYKKTQGLPPPQYIMKLICENQACGNDVPKCLQIAKQLTYGPATRMASASVKTNRVATQNSAK